MESVREKTVLYKRDGSDIMERKGREGMKQEHIDRINELAKKAKKEGLTEEEHAERETLRRAYIESFRQSLQSQLDNTYIVDHNGNKRKLERKQ